MCGRAQIFETKIFFLLEFERERGKEGKRERRVRERDTERKLCERVKYGYVYTHISHVLKDRVREMEGIR